MKWLPTSLGAEPKKVIILIVLLILSPVAYWYGNSSDGPETASVATAPRPTVPVVDPTRIVSARPVNRGRQTRVGTDDFRPSLNLSDDFDLSKVDPTLRTELLAKVREVGEAGGSRSLFEFYTPPPPPPPKVDPIKPVTSAPKPAADTKPVQAAAAKQVAPPIPLKYFGYEGTPRAGQKLRALFVDGEENFIAGENEMIRNRYRVVRIGTTSADVEDTTSQSKQTIRIIDRSDP